MQEFDIIIPSDTITDSSDDGLLKIVEMAKRLGFCKICIAYSLEDYIKLKHKIQRRGFIDGIEVINCILVSPKNTHIAAKYSDFLIARSTFDPESDRMLFENKRIKVIYGLELSSKRDSLHHRNSGLNQVLCRLAVKNNIIIAFSLDSLLCSDGLRRSQILGRMMQNKRFCDKFGVKTIVASFASDEWGLRSKYDLDALSCFLQKRKL